MIVSVKTVSARPIVAHIDTTVNAEQTERDLTKKFPLSRPAPVA